MAAKPPDFRMPVLLRRDGSPDMQELRMRLQDVDFYLMGDGKPIKLHVDYINDMAPRNCGDNFLIIGLNPSKDTLKGVDRLEELVDLLDRITALAHDDLEQAGKACYDELVDFLDEHRDDLERLYRSDK
jgi:hypothetical protein